MLYNYDIDVGQISDSKNSIDKQIRPHVSADFLCNFMRRPEYIYRAIRDMSLKPRYFEEDISYLGISDFGQLTYPMLCFCDIPLSKVSWHMNGGRTEEGNIITGYGQFGVALNKESCLSRDVQPIRYLNTNSRLAVELRSAFQLLIGMEDDITGKMEFLPDVLQRELMYTKPVQGLMRRGDGQPEKRNFKDECEWRYIPSIPSRCSLPLFLDSKHCTKDGLIFYSDALNRIRSTNFPFSVDDVVYLIVPNEEEAVKLIHYIRRLRSREKKDQFKLISKIEIADRFTMNLI